MLLTKSLLPCPSPLPASRPKSSAMAAFLTRPLSTLTLRHFAHPTKNTHPLRPKSVLSPVPHRIAVVGGGLAGLATTYHLLHSINRYLRKRNPEDPPPAPNVTIFDPYPPGCAPGSSAAAGLLHPFTPRVKKLAWRAKRGLGSAHQLIDFVCGDDREGIIRQPGLIRLAFDRKSIQDFIVAANRAPNEAEYLEPEEMGHRFPSLPKVPGVYLPRACVVNVPEYMRRIWGMCLKTGRAEWRQQRVRNMSELGDFDTVIFCAGAYIRQVDGLEHVPIKAVRGQNLIFESDAGAEVPVISKKYVVPDYFGRGVIAGATFENREEGESEESYLESTKCADINRALAELSEPLNKLVPGISEKEVKGNSCGLRALPPRNQDGSIPIVTRVDMSESSSVWVYTGLGSRGLLHHAYLGRCMAHAVASGNEKFIPHEARRFDLTLKHAEGEEAVCIEVNKERMEQQVGVV